MTAASSQVDAYARGADFEELWGAILEEPQNDEPHQKFIRFAVLSQRHLEAATKYEELATRGDDWAPIAERYKKALALQVAAHTMARSPVAKVDRKRARMGWLLIGTGLAFSIGGAAFGSLVGLVGPVALLIGILEIRSSRG